VSKNLDAVEANVFVEDGVLVRNIYHSKRDHADQNGNNLSETIARNGFSNVRRLGQEEVGSWKLEDEEKT